ncbi:MAG: coenzyme F420-0:L-glutamate ligase [Candidatus Binatia bacterium]
MSRIELIGLEGLGEVRKGDSIGRLITEACSRLNLSLQEEDILVVAHKIVSKAEGRIAFLGEIQPSARAKRLSRELGKDPGVLEIILRESRRIIRKGRGTIIVETHHGFICANAGVDLSNVGLDRIALLPQDPDRSAGEIRKEIRQHTGKAPAVIISDSFGRPWRLGTVDVALGVSGLSPLEDYRGINDRYGYELKASVTAVADEMASAAELMMGKKGFIPVIIIRGYTKKGETGTAQELLRPESKDLFRNL